MIDIPKYSHAVILASNNDKLLECWQEAFVDFRLGVVKSVNQLRLEHLLDQDAMLLVDDALPGMGKTNLFQALNQFKEAKIIVMTDMTDPYCLLDLFAAGAKGYCSKNVSAGQLLRAVKGVREGELWMERRLANILLDHLLRSKVTERLEGTNFKPNEKTNLMTKRESEISALIAKGKSDKLIAQELNISLNTVKNHLRNIYIKLELSDRLQLALVVNGILA